MSYKSAAMRAPIVYTAVFCCFFFYSPTLGPNAPEIVLLIAMFTTCAAYVAAGVSAILDLRFIAINKRRNFIITTAVRKNL